jgi:hypothetical protein
LAKPEPYGLWLHCFPGWFSMFRLKHMILLLIISIIFTKVIMINIHHIAKIIWTIPVIATKHFYPKQLFKKLVQGKNSSHVLKKIIFPSNLCNTTIKSKPSYHASCVGQIEYVGEEVHLPSLLKHWGSSSKTCS